MKINQEKSYNIYGSPRSIYDNMYIYGLDFKSAVWMEVHVDDTGQEISGFKIHKETEIHDVDNLVELYILGGLDGPIEVMFYACERWTDCIEAFVEYENELYNIELQIYPCMIGNEMKTYGEKIYEETSENGIHRAIWKNGDNYEYMVKDKEYMYAGEIILFRSVQDEEREWPEIFSDIIVEIVDSIAW